MFSRVYVSAVVVALLSWSVNGEEAPKPVKNPAALLAKAKYDVGVAEAAAEYNRKVAALGRACAADLEAVLKDVTKSGDLDGAVAIRELKSAVEAETKQASGPVQPSAASDHRLAAEARKAIVGKWSVAAKGYKSTWIFEEDGTVLPDPGNKGVWFLDTQHNCINVHFAGPGMVTFPLPIKPAMRINSEQEPGKLTATAEKLK